MGTPEPAALEAADASSTSATLVRAAATAATAETAESAESAEPSVDPDAPEAPYARESRWLRDVYRPNDPQITLRSLLTGAVLGAVLSASDLYIGLKIGWTFGMSITASVLAFALWAGVSRARPSTAPFGLLENNTSQTVASAAAYMASAGLVGSIPAMTILQREGVIAKFPLDGPKLCLWLFATASLGVFVAVPLKRSMINGEQLRFPHGVIAAQTLQTLHQAGRAAHARARALIVAGAVAGAWRGALDSKLWLFRKIPSAFAPPVSIAGISMRSWSLATNSGLLFYAAGAIVGLRTGASMLVGAIVSYGLVGPRLLAANVLSIAPPEVAHDPARWAAFRKAAEALGSIPLADGSALHVAMRSKWSVWPGTAMMLSAALVGLLLRWRVFGGALASILALSRADRAAGTRDPLAGIEVPPRTFLVGLAACTVACVWMQRAWFGVPIAWGVVSVALAFVLSIVAARATGETGVTPVSALGKVTQLLFGVVIPGDAVANLMTATVTAGAAAHSADLLTEVKTGYLLGGSPRKQLWAQLVGVVVGSLACVPLYLLIVKPETIGTTLPAPAAVAWASVAKLLRDGLAGLPRGAVLAAACAAGAGALLTVLESTLPKRLRDYVPSASAIGIAMMIDGHDSIALFLGGVFAWGWTKLRPQQATAYLAVVASGVVAGEGVVGVVSIAINSLLGR